MCGSVEGGKRAPYVKLWQMKEVTPGLIASMAVLVSALNKTATVSALTLEDDN